jgi:hypothetical protein
MAAGAISQITMRGGRCFPFEDRYTLHGLIRPQLSKLPEGRVYVMVLRIMGQIELSTGIVDAHDVHGLCLSSH